MFLLPVTPNTNGNSQNTLNKFGLHGMFANGLIINQLSNNLSVKELKNHRAKRAVEEVADVTVCTRTWTELSNSSALGGTGIIGVPSANACKLTCSLEISCTAVDWDPSSTVAQCWLHLQKVSSVFLRQGTSLGVTHHRQDVVCQETGTVHSG